MLNQIRTQILHLKISSAYFSKKFIQTITASYQPPLCKLGMSSCHGFWTTHRHRQCASCGGKDGGSSAHHHPSLQSRQGTGVGHRILQLLLSPPPHPRCRAVLPNYPTYRPEQLTFWTKTPQYLSQYSTKLMFQNIYILIFQYSDISKFQYLNIQISLSQYYNMLICQFLNTWISKYFITSILPYFDISISRCSNILTFQYSNIKQSNIW